MRLFQKRSRVQEATTNPEEEPVVEDKHSSNITDITSSLTKVAKNEGPPPGKEEKKRKELVKKEFEKRKVVRANRIQALLDKSQEHRYGM
jgi:hypothetical protein